MSKGFLFKRYVCTKDEKKKRSDPATSVNITNVCKHQRRFISLYNCN